MVVLGQQERLVHQVLVVLMGLLVLQVLMVLVGRQVLVDPQGLQVVQV